jgi:hypothetical protein
MDGNSTLYETICTLCKQIIRDNDEFTLSCPGCGVLAHANCAGYDVMTVEELEGVPFDCANCSTDAPLQPSSPSELDTLYTNGPADEVEAADEIGSADEMEDADEVEGVDERENVVPSSPPPHITSSHSFNELFDEVEDEEVMEEIHQGTPNHSRVYQGSRNRRRCIDSSPIRPTVEEDMVEENNQVDNSGTNSQRHKPSTTSQPSAIGKSSTTPQPFSMMFPPTAAQPAVDALPTPSQLAEGAVPTPPPPSTNTLSRSPQPSATNFHAPTSIESFRAGASRAWRDQRGSLLLTMNAKARERRHELTAEEVNRGLDAFDETTKKVEDLLDELVNNL